MTEARTVKAAEDTRWDHAALFQRTAQRLWSAIYAYTGGSRSVADDVVAETFARAIAHDHDIREPEPWLFRTAFRLAAAELRRRKRIAPMTDEAVVADTQAVEVVSALRRLNPAQRAAVYLHYQLDLPVRDVARITGTSVANVKVQLHRGRARLRRLLSDEEVDHA